MWEKVPIPSSRGRQVNPKFSRRCPCHMSIDIRLRYRPNLGVPVRDITMDVKARAKIPQMDIANLKNEGCVSVLKSICCQFLSSWFITLHHSPAPKIHGRRIQQACTFQPHHQARTHICSTGSLEWRRCITLTRCLIFLERGLGFDEFAMWAVRMSAVVVERHRQHLQATSRCSTMTSQGLLFM